MPRIIIAEKESRVSRSFIIVMILLIRLLVLVTLEEMIVGVDDD